MLFKNFEFSKINNNKRKIKKMPKLFNLLKNKKWIDKSVHSRKKEKNDAKVLIFENQNKRIRNCTTAIRVNKW